MSTQDERIDLLFRLNTAREKENKELVAFCRASKKRSAVIEAMLDVRIDLMQQQLRGTRRLAWLLFFLITMPSAVSLVVMVVKLMEG